MKFCSYQSNLESLMIVDFNPEINCNIYIDDFDCVTQNYDPIKIRIIDYIDNNGSKEFLKWINDFNETEQNTKGIDMFFFKLNFEKYEPIMALRGCSIKTLSTSYGLPTVSVNFFAYSLHKENS